MQYGDFPRYLKRSQQREVCSNYHLSLPGALLARGTFGQPISSLFWPTKPAELSFSGIFSNLLQLTGSAGNLDAVPERTRRDRQLATCGAFRSDWGTPEGRTSYGMEKAHWHARVFCQTSSIFGVQV